MIDKKTSKKSVLGSYKVEAEKIFPISIKKAWDLITSEEGTKIWLGPAMDIEFKPGQIFELSKGQVGEILKIKKNEWIQFKWHVNKAAHHGTVVEIIFVPAESKTSVKFRQENLKSRKDQGKMKLYWQRVLEQLYVLSQGM